jgi:hypothetical protein
MPILLILLILFFVVWIPLMAWLIAELITSNIALDYLSKGPNTQMPMWVTDSELRDKLFSSRPLKALHFHFFGGPTQSIADIVDAEWKAKGWL